MSQRVDPNRPCKTCQRTPLEVSFHFDSSGYRWAICDECRKLRSKKWYRDNKEKAKNIQRSYYKLHKRDIDTYHREWRNNNKSRSKIYAKKCVAKRAEWFIKLKEKLVCFECADNRTYCLQFHHLDPAQKSFHLNAADVIGKSRKEIEEELKKTVVLCANCHLELHYLVDQVDLIIARKEITSVKDR